MEGDNESERSVYNRAQRLIRKWRERGEVGEGGGGKVKVLKKKGEREKVT